ncbi:MAG: chemotaxis protein CheA [Thermodesulfobacteriota bacterium]
MAKEFKAGQAFIEEAREELLPELENSLLELGEAPEDMDLINRVFRALHTLKGSGAMFGFDRISELAHELETIFDNVRNGCFTVDNRLVELTLTAKDRFQMLVEDPSLDGPEAVADLVAAFRQLAPEDATAGQKVINGEAGPLAWSLYHIRFKPRPGIFVTGTNPLLLLDELHELGVARVVAHVDGIPPLEEMDPESCYTWWDVLLATDRGANAIRDVFIFVEDECDLAVNLVADNLQPGQEAVAFDGMAAALLADETIDIDGLRQLFADAVSSGESPAAAASDEGAKGPAARTSTARVRSLAGTISSMRVQARKLDQLVNLVGELVIAQTRLSRLAGGQEDPALMEIAEVIERLSNDLRDTTLDIRMLPIGSSFGKFKRVVWDLSSQKGKEVELVTEGAATELDKTVIERLDDPLVHLLRNSIDHGIETPDERERAGKPRQGKIVFSAEHAGGNVIITISDDGRGIDAEAVRARAVEKGLLAAGASPTEKELLNFIFEPGFSTADQVSDLSGRGVGMDVVRQNITALRGKVSVSSAKGEGTRIRMSIPLTLAIIDGLEVRVDKDHFIVPLAVVGECMEKPEGRERFISLRDQLVPFLSLRQWFGVEGQPPAHEQVVVASLEKKMVGLVVDEVIGLQQAVIKNLGHAYKDIQGVSGATIQGDGSIALILDVEPLIHKAEAAA